MLEDFMAQGGFRQGVSHARNTEVLSKCDAQILRSYEQLQVRVYLQKELDYRLTLLRTGPFVVGCSKTLHQTG